MGFTVSKLSLTNNGDVPTKLSEFEEFEDAISMVLDSMNREKLIITESSEIEPSYYHIFRFNSDGKIVFVDHSCLGEKYCKYHNLELLNR